MKENMRAWTKVFHAMDRNNSGNVSSNELSNILVRLGYKISLDEVREILDNIDTNENGTI